jgi:hypothetical protein
MDAGAPWFEPRRHLMSAGGRWDGGAYRLNGFYFSALCSAMMRFASATPKQRSPKAARCNATQTLSSRLGKGTSSVRDAHPAANFPVLISKPAPFMEDHRPYDERAKQNCQRADRISSHEPISHAERKTSAMTATISSTREDRHLFVVQEAGLPRRTTKLRQA